MGCVQKPQEELRSSGPESMKSVQSRILDEVRYEPFAEIKADLTMRLEQDGKK